MKSLEVPTTDSGYPTPRDDLPSSSRSLSPNRGPLTSTPVRGYKSIPIKERVAGSRHNLWNIESPGPKAVSPENESSSVIKGVKSILNLGKELKTKHQDNKSLRDENGALQRKNESLLGENESLRDENFSLHQENESLREETFSLREESKRGAKSLFRDEFNENVFPVVPKLQIHDLNKDDDSIPPDQFESNEQIKKEPLSFFKEESGTIHEGKSENMRLSDSKPPAKVFTATAIIQVDTEKIDADAQTEDHVNVMNANLQIKVDQLHSDIEVIKKEKSDLKDRLYDYENLKAKFEDDKEKLSSELQKKLKSNQEKLTRLETTVENVQSRLNRKKKELEEVKDENRHLLEDRNTHEFELDELKVQMQHVEKQKKEAEENVELLQKNIEELERSSDEKKCSYGQLEKDMATMKNEFEKLTNELQKKSDIAQEKKNDALEQLKKIQTENMRITKENQYLSEAQQVLLDSEINLKNEVDVLQAKLRNSESKLSQANEQLINEKRRREQTEKKVTSLELQNQELKEEKQDSNELLEELKKGKLEIDHLRQQLQRQSEESEEMNRLKEAVLEFDTREQRMKEKLEEAAKREGESDARIEGYIRSESAANTELDRLKVEITDHRTKLEAVTDELLQKDAKLIEFERVLAELRLEYEEFKQHANAQYDDEIFIRNREIDNLRARLIELETYPGQTISVSQRTAEVQTDEFKPDTELIPAVSEFKEQVISPAISLVSEELVSSHLTHLEERIKSVIEKMKQIVLEQHIECMSADLRLSPIYHVCETFKNIIDTLHSILYNTDEQTDPVEEVERFWESLHQRVQHLVTIMEEKVEITRQNYTENIRKVREQWEKQNDELKEELNEAKAIGEQRGYFATQFKEQYEIEEKQKEEFMADNLRQMELRKEELAEYENLERDLRERLERAEHTIQMNAREKLKRTEDYEAELENLTANFQRNVKEHRRKIAKTEEDLIMEKRKRASDKVSMTTLIESCESLKKTCEYLKNRNSLRQKLINHMHATLIKIQKATDANKSKRQIIELNEHVNKTGLLHSDDEESLKPFHSNRSQDLENERRVLGDYNQRK